jgi:hypothetical protein
LTVRQLLPLFLLVSTLTFAGPTAPPAFDPIAFQQRFEKADLDKDGKLTREEAYAEFPRMPEYFDEIDANGDGRITLKEVRNAMEKRVNAALDASKAGKRYVIPSPSSNKQVDDSKGARYFPDREAAVRHFQGEHYQSFDELHHIGTISDEPVQPIQAPAQLKRQF